MSNHLKYTTTPNDTPEGTTGLARMTTEGEQITVGFSSEALSIARGLVPGMSHVNKFGRYPTISIAAGATDIWDGGGIYVPPTTDRVHQIVSTSAEDAGTLKSGGTATGGSLTTLIDTAATFSTDGVAVGDVVLHDTDQDHSVVTSVDSETQLTIRTMHHSDAFSLGDAYRVVNPSGTGAAVAHIVLGVEEDGTEHTEFIILNGLTNVATLNSYFRITRMHIHGVGSNGVNVGIIKATADTDATVTAQINANNGQTLMAFYHVPMGKTGYMTAVHASMNRPDKISDAMADISIRTRLWGNGTDGNIVKGYANVSIGGGFFFKNFNPYSKISQGTDIWIRCESVTDNDTDISAGFDIILINN